MLLLCQLKSKIKFWEIFPNNILLIDQLLILKLVHWFKGRMSY